MFSGLRRRRLGSPQAPCRPRRAIAGDSCLHEVLRLAPAYASPPRPLLLRLVIMMLAAATAATAEAGSLGTGRNVPWWYPSRLWGMDRDAGSGWGSYYDGSTLWRKKRRHRGERGGGGAGWPPQDPYLRWRATELADLAREFVQGCVARGLGEEEERTGDEPQCLASEASNVTLRRLGENVDRCE